jgi:hypothetical protein
MLIMKNFLFILLILMPFCSYGQLFDSFSSAELFESNRWGGDTDHFLLTASGLRLSRELSVTANYTSYLSTSVETAGIVAWEADVTLDFNPSAYNNARFYLLADAANLADAAESWYVQLGGTKDEVALYRQEGSKRTVIIRSDSLLSANSGNRIIVRVELQEGKLLLGTRGADDNFFYLEGETEAPDLPSSTYVGWLCRYTKTFADKYWLHSVTLSGETLFDSSDSDDGSTDNAGDGDGDSGDGEGDGSDGNDGDGSDDSEPLPSYPAPRYGQIVITEIMANPKNAVGLPEAEYVELHNRTDSTLSLDSCTYIYNEKRLPLPARSLGPGAYAILCAEADAATFGPTVDVIPLASFPQLANSGKLIYLENADGELLHAVAYSDAWYGSTSLKKGGHSLEAADVGLLFADSTTWSASTAAAGGTPGAPNSLDASAFAAPSPHLLRHAMAADGSLTLAFSQPVDANRLASIFVAASGEASVEATDYPLNRTFSVALADDVISDYASVSLSGLTSVDGLPLLDAGTLRFGNADSAEAGDIVINELLWQPPTEASVPFVELYNASDKLIDLASLSLATADADSLITRRYPIATEATLLEPDGYALVSLAPLPLFDYYGYEATPRIIVADALPPLAETEGNIALLDGNGTVIDRLDYSTAMHSLTTASPVGVSLERRDPLSPASLRGNWTSGSLTTRGATPGRANAALGTEVVADPSREELLVGDASFALLRPYLSLGEDPAAAELTLLYRLDEADVRLMATLYNATGVTAARFACGESLAGAEGELAWGATWRGDRTNKTGIYLLLLEYTAPSGKTGKVKMPVAIVP